MYPIRRGKRQRLLVLTVVTLGLICTLINCPWATGNQGKISDNTTALEDTVVDIDGNVYTTVTIGTQVWLVENLKVTHYRDGHQLPLITDDTVWSTLSSGAYCWYNNDSTNKHIYGALYNFLAVSDTCGLCPEGWHIPTISEWLALEAYLGGGDVAGGKVKEAGTTHWNRPNVGASGESGFVGLPGGGRGVISGSGEIGEYSTWWSATAYDSVYAWHWGLSRGKASIRCNPGHRASGFSVRCIKD